MAYRYIALVLLFFSFAIPVFAGTTYQSFDLGSNQVSSTVFTSYTRAFEDVEAELTIEDIIRPNAYHSFLISDKADRTYSFGGTNSAIWISFVLENSSDRVERRFLELPFAELSEVDFYTVSEHGHYEVFKTGASRPFSTRAYDNRFFVFPLTMEPKSQKTFYLRVKSKSEVLIPLVLWQEQAFFYHVRNDSIRQVAFYSVVIGLMLFNLLLFITSKSISFLQYIAFSLSMSLLIASGGGVAHQYLWPNIGWWSNNAANFFSICSMATFMVFIRRQFNTKQSLPKLHGWMNWLLISAPIVAVFLCVFPLNVVFLVQPYALISLVVILMTASFKAYQKHRNAYFILCAFLSLLTCSVIYIAQSNGLIESNTFTISSLQMGASLEMLFLVVMLADQFNQIRKEKETAKMGLIDTQKETLLAQEQLLNNLKNSEHELNLKVHQRTQEVNAAFKMNNAILLNSPIPMLLTDSNGVCLEANESAGLLVGGSRERMLGVDIKENRAWYESGLIHQLHRVLATNQQTKFEAKLTSRFGKALWLDIYLLPLEIQGKMRILIQLFDLTKQKKNEKKLEELAFYDGLTELPNRRLLLSKLNHALENGVRYQQYCALLFLDLDKFKLLNDTYGHDIGDKLLIEVAKRLISITRQSDTVARLGGDEFIILLEGLGSDESLAQEYADKMAEKVREVLSEEYWIDGIFHSGAGSVGVTVFSGEDSDADQVLKEADTAMYEAKKTKLS
ncbi:diguanylate cyclase [Marinomonas sp. C2222]|uniref:Diguanylate cyclase n=1 Tax=Marinomonas sargassi TaxID=2984494 RepID=A0ABT2YR91_9GAMM|nr:diguanylate cyclase [Marinomonas sargassi]MCV2402416.1 diguanylate cyclase [Marinomonas sargassi]